MPTKTKVYFQNKDECDRLKIENPVLYKQVCIKGHPSRTILTPSKPKPTPPSPKPPRPPVPPRPAPPRPVVPDIPVPSPPLKPPEQPFVLPKGQPKVPFITEEIIQNKEPISLASSVGVAGIAGAVRARRIQQMANLGYDYRRLSAMEEGLELTELTDLPPIEIAQTPEEVATDIIENIARRERELQRAGELSATGARYVEPITQLEDVALLEEGGVSSGVATALTRAGIRLRRVGQGFNVARGAVDAVETGIQLEEIGTGVSTARAVATTLEAGEVATAETSALASAGLTLLAGAVAFGITEAGLRIAEGILGQPRSGIVEVKGNIKDKLLEELNKNPDINKKAINEINSGEQYFITTTEEKDKDGKLKTILVKRLSGSDFAEAVDTAKRFPDAYKGVDPYILQAMGLSRDLSTKSADELDNLYAEDLGNWASRRYIKGEEMIYDKQDRLAQEYAQKSLLQGRQLEQQQELNNLENQLDKYHHAVETAKHELKEQHEGFMTDVKDKRLRGEYQKNYNKQMEKLNTINPPENYVPLGDQKITTPTGEVVDAVVVAS
jgi:hypothetical protein